MKGAKKPFVLAPHGTLVRRLISSHPDHTLDELRDRLVADDAALADWLAQHPGTDSQQLRALVRQIRKDAQPDKTSISQGLAPRRGRAYRELFQLIREQMQDEPDE